MFTNIGVYVAGRNWARRRAHFAGRISRSGCTGHLCYESFLREKFFIGRRKFCYFYSAKAHAVANALLCALTSVHGPDES